MLGPDANADDPAPTALTSTPATDASIVAAESGGGSDSAVDSSGWTLRLVNFLNPQGKSKPSVAEPRKVTQPTNMPPSVPLTPSVDAQLEASPQQELLAAAAVAPHAMMLDGERAALTARGRGQLRLLVARGRHLARTYWSSNTTNAYCRLSYVPSTHAAAEAAQDKTKGMIAKDDPADRLIGVTNVDRSTLNPVWRSLCKRESGDPSFLSAGLQMLGAAAGGGTAVRAHKVLENVTTGWFDSAQDTSEDAFLYPVLQPLAHNDPATSTAYAATAVHAVASGGEDDGQAVVAPWGASSSGVRFSVRAHYQTQEPGLVGEFVLPLRSLVSDEVAGGPQREVRGWVELQPRSRAVANAACAVRSSAMAAALVPSQELPRPSNGSLGYVWFRAQLTLPPAAERLCGPALEAELERRHALRELTESADGAAPGVVATALANFAVLADKLGLMMSSVPRDRALRATNRFLAKQHPSERNARTMYARTCAKLQASWVGTARMKSVSSKAWAPTFLALRCNRLLWWSSEEQALRGLSAENELHIKHKQAGVGGPSPMLLRELGGASAKMVVCIFGLARDGSPVKCNFLMASKKDKASLEGAILSLSSLVL